MAFRLVIQSGNSDAMTSISNFPKVKVRLIKFNESPIKKSRMPRIKLSESTNQINRMRSMTREIRGLLRNLHIRTNVEQLFSNKETSNEISRLIH